MTATASTGLSLESWDIARPDGADWIPWGQGSDARAKILANADGYLVVFVQAKVGYRGTPHRHEHAEFLYVIDARVRSQGKDVSAGGRVCRRGRLDPRRHQGIDADDLPERVPCLIVAQRHAAVREAKLARRRAACHGAAFASQGSLRLISATVSLTPGRDAGEARDLRPARRGLLPSDGSRVTDYRAVIGRHVSIRSSSASQSSRSSAI